jgi:hypothetical protein
MNDLQLPEFAVGATVGSLRAVAPALAELEQVIERGLQTFIDVGKALAEIRQDRLHLGLGYQTFEEYCERRWNWTRRTGHYYIQAACAAENVKSISHSNCPSLTQAIELAKLPPEKQREIADRIDFSRTTVREVRDRVRELQSKPVRQREERACEDLEEWRTPPEIVGRAERVLRTIDLIPCGDPSLNPPSKARIEGSIEGLSVPWLGRIYLDPPQNQPTHVWVEKLCTEQFEGNVTEAIAVLPAHVEADWFHLLHECAACFVRERVDGNFPGKPAPFPLAVVYFGNSVARFQEVFRDLGSIWVQWKKTSPGGAQ